MFKNINAKNIVNSDNLIKEPLYLAAKEIKNLGAKKIILRGEGNGKSTLLYFLQKNTAYSNNPFIVVSFETMGWSIFTIANNNSTFNEELFRYYIECKFASEILNYLKDFYEFSYKLYFEKYHQFIYDNIDEIYHYINNSIYNENMTIDINLKNKEAVKKILNMFKKEGKFKNISLGIDNFDKLNNSDSLTQKIISEYFNLFNKVIITSKSDFLPDEWYKTYFYENSNLYTYVPYEITYGKYEEIVKEILIKRIDEHNRKERENNNFVDFPKDWLNYQNLKLLIDKTNGNIKIMLDILRNLISHYNFYNHREIKEENLNYYIDEHIKTDLELKRMFIKPHIYL